MAVLKELILTVSTLGGCSAVLKELLLTVSKRTDFNSF